MIGRSGNSWPYRDSYSDPKVVQPLTSRYTDFGITAPLLCVLYVNMLGREGQGGVVCCTVDVNLANGCILSKFRGHIGHCQFLLFAPHLFVNINISYQASQ
jgi:hypothetical protein